MENSSSKVTTWFKVVAIIAILWNIMGLLSFIAHVFISDEALALLPENEAALYSQYPLWTDIVFAIAVFGGLFGSIALLMKKKVAKSLLLLSLLAIVIQMSHSLFLTDSVAVYGNMSYLMPVLLVVVGIGLVWLADYAGKKEWLS
jgi:hypothetical protein